MVVLSTLGQLVIKLFSVLGTFNLNLELAFTHCTEYWVPSTEYWVLYIVRPLFCRSPVKTLEISHPRTQQSKCQIQNGESEKWCRRCWLLIDGIFWYSGSWAPSHIHNMSQPDGGWHRWGGWLRRKSTIVHVLFLALFLLINTCRFSPTTFRYSTTIRATPWIYSCYIYHRHLDVVVLGWYDRGREQPFCLMPNIVFSNTPFMNVALSK